MESVPLLALLLYVYPEIILMAGAGLVVVGVKPNYFTLAAFSLIMTITKFFMFDFSWPPWLLATITIIFGAIVLTYFHNIALKKTITALLLAMLFRNGLVSIIHTIIYNNTTLTPDIVRASENALLLVLVNLPQMILIGFTWYLIYRARGMHINRYAPFRRYRGQA